MQLDTQLAALLPLLAPEDRGPGDRAIEKLHELRNQQASDHEARRALGEQIAEASRDLEGEREKLGRLETKLRDEAQALGVSVDRLPEVVAPAQAAAELEGRIDERIEQLLDAGDGLELQALHAEAEAVGDPDAAAARLEAIAHEREQLELDRTEATPRRVVDAARASGRGPLIERAGHYFGLLADSACDGLDLASHGEEVFPVAVRATVLGCTRPRSRTGPTPACSISCGSRAVCRVSSTTLTRPAWYR